MTLMRDDKKGTCNSKIRQQIELQEEFKILFDDLKKSNATVDEKIQALKSHQKKYEKMLDLFRKSDQ